MNHFNLFVVMPMPAQLSSIYVWVYELEGHWNSSLNVFSLPLRTSSQKKAVKWSFKIIFSVGQYSFFILPKSPAVGRIQEHLLLDNCMNQVIGYIAQYIDFALPENEFCMCSVAIVYNILSYHLFYYIRENERHCYWNFLIKMDKIDKSIFGLQKMYFTKYLQSILKCLT